MREFCAAVAICVVLVGASTTAQSLGAAASHQLLQRGDYVRNADEDQRFLRW